MQTPGLPASSPSSSRNTADSFFSEKPANAGEHFGDVMNRALHSGTGILPVRSRTQGQDDNSEDDADSKSSDLKTRKPLRKASVDSAAGNVSANPHFIGLAAHTPPASTPTPTQPNGESHESSPTGDPIAALSSDASKTTVANADASENKAENSTAKPVPAGLEPHSAETDGAIEHLQNPDIAKALTTQSAEATAEPAKPTVSDDATAPASQIAESKNPVEAMSAPPPPGHGIPAAKQDVTMKKAEKMQKVAGSAEQDLPGNTASGSEELPKGQKVAEKVASHGGKAESAAIELPTRISTSVESPSSTITSAAPAASTGVDSRVLERTHDIVALHAMRITDTGAETLHVVVKPGAGIQLSLELRQSARGIEVSASLHKGDYDQLSQHWPDLQQRLEARGVRVSSLTPSENYTGTGHHFHQSKQQSSQQESLQAGAFAEFALAGSMTEAPGTRAARASAYRGWETWA